MRLGIVFASCLMLGFAGSAVGADLPPDPENTLYLDLDYGRVVIRMRPDIAPNHVARIKHLTRGGYYDGMVFHRVIAGFMAQTGDPSGTGSSGSGRELKAEFTRTPQTRGTVSMARKGGKNTADSQWFIVLGDGNRDSLDGKYTVWGEVTEGMQFVDRIKKGNASKNGSVTEPDRVVRLQIAADAALAKTASADLLKRPDAAEAARNFSGVEYRCSALAQGDGAQPQAALAKIWAHGYLAGYYKAQKNLKFTGADNAADAALAETCGAYPLAFLMNASATQLAKTPRDLPGATAAFAPATYTCKDFTAARGGANKAEADFAEMWSFAFIQGFKNLGQPDLEIPFDARPQLINPIVSNCAKNPDTLYIDMTAAVAEKVKLKSA
jgi:peptidylprolyl isomerase